MPACYHQCTTHDLKRNRRTRTDNNVQAFGTEGLPFINSLSHTVRERCDLSPSPTPAESEGNRRAVKYDRTLRPVPNVESRVRIMLDISNCSDSVVSFSSIDYS